MVAKTTLLRTKNQLFNKCETNGILFIKDRVTRKLARFGNR